MSHNKDQRRANKSHLTNEPGIWACDLQEWINVTEKVINDIRVTEFQFQSQAKWWAYDQQSGLPTAKDKHFAEPVVPDGHVMQST